jgi:VCBS repeat-containing protein
MSKSVVPAAAVAHAKHLVNNKKLIKHSSGQKPADTDAQAAAHKEEAANVADAKEAQQHTTSMSDAVLSDFSFAGALSSAAASTASLAEGAQADGGYSDDDNDGSGTIVAIGAAGLAILGGVVAFGGGGEKNKPPVVSAASQAVTTKEDTAATVTVAATDPNNDPLTYSVTTNPTKGTVTGGTGGAFTYTPSANFNGADSFVVTASDGKGGTVTQTVNVTVSAVNDAPTVDKATVAVAGTEDTVVTGQTVATDVDSTALTYTISTAATNGTVTIGTDGKYTYTPKANYNGADSFVVTVSDGTASATQTVNITLAAVADNPTADAESTTKLTVAEDASGVIVVAFTDPDAPTDTNLKFTLTDTPDNGTLTTNAEGNLVYTPNANFNGTDSITYTIADNNGGSTTVTVPITVTPVNDAPDITAPSKLDASNGAAVDFAITATDVDGDTLTYTFSGTGSDNITAKAGGGYTYTPDKGFTGTDTFVITANDGNGGTDTQSVSVQVGPAVTTRTIDVGNPADPSISVVASDASYILTDDAKVNTNVGIFGFTADDTIKVTNAVASDYNYTASNGDLLISFNNGAQVNLITIEDVLATNAVVFSYATAQSAIGNPNFMTFG